MDEDLLIPVRMINEFVYCNRLFFIEFVQGDFVDSFDTVHGRRMHKNVDESTGKIPEPDNFYEDFKATAVTLSSSKLGIIAKMDMIEGKNNEAIPVEYKKGKKPDNGIYMTDTVQVCCQGLILRDNGFESNHGMVYYAESRERIEINFSDEIVEKTIDTIDRIKAVLSQNVMPDPLIDSPKCQACSLVGICLPDEVNFISSENNNEIRRLYPARMDKMPLYVQKQGAYITKSGEELVIKYKNEILSKARIMEISNISIFGNVQITTQAIQELLKREIRVCYFSYGSWFYGITLGMEHKNVNLRINQYKIFNDIEKSIAISKNIVAGKIKNSRTLLRRNAKKDVDKGLNELKKILNLINGAGRYDELLGLEGDAARIFFMNFSSMLNNNFKFDFTSRNRRPPKDPVNAMLSYTYSLLLKDVTVSLYNIGLDPFLGFYHRPKYGKPALALDMMEEYRSIICDSTVINSINNGEIGEEDFINAGGSSTFSESGRRKIIAGYERRMDSLVTHPVFGYKVSYRRIIEVQARLLSRYINNEIKEYPAFYTR